MQPVERTDPDGVDFGWVMQTTFVLTIVVGAPVVALLSMAVELSSWGQWASFAVRVGAAVWFVTAVATYLYARRREAREDAPDAAEVADAGDD
ncbi:DUF5822 domain-containing protein [Halobium salinum]|uniref:DUF5822 domain-containing protein n=1 Tax=Halobium salinum TaxID=1364940 RepID=A0ABD5P8A3_9EURY|nr:DUF5822 domain-containing protein [Halobium salinum]